MTVSPRGTALRRRAHAGDGARCRSPAHHQQSALRGEVFSATVLHLHVVGETHHHGQAALERAPPLRRTRFPRHGDRAGWPPSMRQAGRKGCRADARSYREIQCASPASFTAMMRVVGQGAFALLVQARIPYAGPCSTAAIISEDDAVMQLPARCASARQSRRKRRAARDFLRDSLVKTQRYSKRNQGLIEAGQRRARDDRDPCPRRLAVRDAVLSGM